MNSDFNFPERKTDINDYQKKLMSKQQSANNYNIEYEYNENQDSNKKLQKKAINNNNYIDSKDKSNIENNASDGFHSDNYLYKYNSNEFNNYNYLESRLIDNNNQINNNKPIINDKIRILYKRINYFKERCINSLGQNFYNKAYNFLRDARKNNYQNNDKIREYLSNTFGKNNIGYWQLIDQILLLEDILETN